MRPIHHIAALLSALLRDRQGATAIEYGLIAALIVVSMMVALSAFADTTIGIWEMVSRVVVETGPKN